MPETFKMREAFPIIKRSEGLTKKEAIDQLKPDGGSVLFYTPDCCRFGTISEVMENSNVFEFRCFSPKSELHWVRQGNSGKGTAVLLEEEKGERLNIEGTKYWGTEDHYLLWGSCLESNKPKSVLFEYRIGRLEIPCEIPKGERAYLHFREIFVEDKYGNLTFYTELLRDIGGLS